MLRSLLLSLLLLGPAAVSGAAAPDAQELCSAQRAAVIKQSGIVVREQDKDVFVNPYLWRELKPNAQQLLTFWAGRCLLKTEYVSVRDVHTKDELARWSPTLGYRQVTPSSDTGR